MQSVAKAFLEVAGAMNLDDKVPMTACTEATWKIAQEWAATLKGNEKDILVFTSM